MEGRLPPRPPAPARPHPREVLAEKALPTRTNGESESPEDLAQTRRAGRGGVTSLWESCSQIPPAG